ncbi:MAG: D-2-hydroxyacid dehydrogenase [Spirochaetes bacterium]|nr:D-2-hydroxyacid dehydrogenase [Spirochaetota bacterium]
MKIVVLDGYTLNPGDLSWEGFESLGQVALFDRTDEKDIVSRINDAECVITNKTPISAATIDACPGIRYIGVLATGYNVVDVQAASSKGITVTNIPTYGSTAVSQFVFALLLEICHHVQNHHNSVQEGKWENSKDFCFWNYPLIELAGKTMGIIGLGKIGQVTAKIAQGFGMNVLAYDEYPIKELENESLSYTDLDTLYADSDIISLHCPLFESTRGIINKDSIEKMKDGVIIINTSRGPLIVEKDLAEALKAGKVKAAGVDVVSTEPIQGGNPLLTAPNCFITPHIAWAPFEARSRLMEIAVENLRAFKANKIINEIAVPGTFSTL